MTYQTETTIKKKKKKEIYGAVNRLYVLINPKSYDDYY